MSSTHITIANESGQVYVAGPNTNGQLSIGTTAQTNTFTLARLDASTNLTSVLHAADGSAHSLFLRSTGLVYAAGLNANGQLGLGTTADMSFAALVKQSAGVDLSNVIGIAAGGAHSVFLLRDGSALACGLNTSGQLGDGTLTQRTFPVPMRSFDTVVAAKASSLSFYYKFEGNLYNEARKTVDATTTGNLSFPTISRFGTRSLGMNEGLTTGQGISSGISISSYPTLANSRLTVSFWHLFRVPTTTNSIDWNWIWKLSSNNYETLIYSDNNSARINHYSNINGTITYTVIGTITANTWNHIAMVASGTTTTFYLNGAQAATASLNVISSGQAWHTHGLSIGGNMYGRIDEFQLYEDALTAAEIGTLYAGPVANSLRNISNVSAGNAHTLLTDSSNIAYSCGLNTNGQIGNGLLTDSSYVYPVMITGRGILSSVSQVIAGGSHSLALTTANTVYSWGANAAGQLAIGTTVDSSFATLCLSAAATTLTNIVQAAAGEAHSLFLTATGTVFACGSNSAGQLADGTLVNRSYPVQVLTAAGQPLTTVESVHATANQSYFMTQDGTIYAAGFNGTGAFGNGTTTNSSFAIVILSPSATVLRNMGYSASYARKRGATVANLITAGYTTLEIVCAGYTKAQLVAGGLTISAMLSAGVSYRQLAFAGYTDSELVAAGYTSFAIVPSVLDGNRPPPPTPIYRYTFDTGTQSGNFIKNESTGLYDASINNGTITTGSQQVGTAALSVVQSGAANFYSVWLPNINFANYARFSVSIWFRVGTTSVNYGWIFSYRLNNTNSYSPIYFAVRVNGSSSGSAMRAYTNGASTSTTIVSSVSFGVWHHVVCVYNAGTLITYYDGAQSSSNTFNLTNSSGSLCTTNWLTSTNDGASGLDYIDDYRFYDTVLSSTEVANIYNKTA